MRRNWQIPRRAFLKGLGAIVALPTLEAMAPPVRLLAASASPAPAAPTRMAFVYIPNGANMADWTPAATGADFELPKILEPLQSVRKDIMVLSGLAQHKAFANGDGPGDHARASATFLTGCQARKTAGSDIRVGVSVDQIAAQNNSLQTRFPSLELGCDRAQQTGNCDSGYSCAYSFNISWKGESTPLPPEIDPRLVFERLFSSGDKDAIGSNRAQRDLYRKSILDFVLDDAHRLQANLGQTDRRKLDEYLSDIRDLERRIETAEKFAADMPDSKKPSGIPKAFDAHMRIMFDLLALAFQTDTTRVATFQIAHDGSNRSYADIGAPEGHHDLSHHGGDAAKKEKIAKINHYHMTQFAYFLDKLKSIPEGDGTLLDHSMILYGGGIADGNSHAHNNLPILLAGKGGGTIQTGRHVKYSKDTPLNNLYLSMLDRMGAPTEHLGDSTGRLQNLT